MTDNGEGMPATGITRSPGMMPLHEAQAMAADPFRLMSTISISTDLDDWLAQVAEQFGTNRAALLLKFLVGDALSRDRHDVSRKHLFNLIERLELSIQDFDTARASLPRTYADKRFFQLPKRVVDSLLQLALIRKVSIDVFIAAILQRVRRSMS